MGAGVNVQRYAFARAKRQRAPMCCPMPKRSSATRQQRPDCTRSRRSDLVQYPLYPSRDDAGRRSERPSLQEIPWPCSAPHGITANTAAHFCSSTLLATLITAPTSMIQRKSPGGSMTNAGLRSRNVALYYPRVRVPDPLNEFRLRSIGASGTVAGLFARTDGRAACGRRLPAPTRSPAT